MPYRNRCFEKPHVALKPFVSYEDYESGMEKRTPYQWLKAMKYHQVHDHRADEMMTRLEHNGTDMKEAQDRLVKMELTGKPEYDWQVLEEEQENELRKVKRAVILERHRPTIEAICTERLARADRIRQLYAETYAYYEALHTTKRAKQITKDVKDENKDRICKAMELYRRVCKKLKLTELRQGEWLTLSHDSGYAKFKIA